MTEEAIELDYEVFDRQMENLMAMSRVLATEVDDCGVHELTFDLVSLQTKSARLCYMADVDYALQQTEIAHVRAEKNTEYHELFELLMAQYVSPMMMRFVEDDINCQPVPLFKYPSSSPNLSTFLPRLQELVEADNQDGWMLTLNSIAEKQALFAKNIKMTSFPGMQPTERFWRLLLFYLQMCYLMYHFRRTNRLCRQEIAPEEMGRLLTAAIQNYVTSEEGSKELELFFAKLTFNNDNRKLNVQQLQTAQKALLDEVPTALQLCYIKHIGNIDALGREIQKEQFTKEDMDALVIAIAKWQMLEHEIGLLLHPQSAEKQLYNEVFHTVVNGKNINLRKLKKVIKRMLAEVTRKNQWMCVWCVLKHHNLLSNTQIEPFARQMMHKDWFGDISEEKRIKGDSLRDYKGYFTIYDYTRWDVKQFNAYCEIHNKNKLSMTLLNRFLQTCISMEDAFEEGNEA